MYARPNYNSILSLYHEKDNRCSSFYGFFRFIFRSRRRRGFMFLRMGVTGMRVPKKLLILP